MATSFYEEGGFEFLKWIEGIHHQCASICEPPLFYLTKDISEGMPEDECLVEQIEESKKLAVNVEWSCFFFVCVVFQSALWAIPLNAPLEANKDKKCCKNKPKDDKV